VNDTEDEQFVVVESIEDQMLGKPGDQNAPDFAKFLCLELAQDAGARILSNPQ
jgi:hypothetical protein